MVKGLNCKVLSEIGSVILNWLSFSGNPENVT